MDFNYLSSFFVGKIEKKNSFSLNSDYPANKLLINFH